MVRCSRRRSSDQLVNLQARLRIQAGGGLVQEQHLRIVQQRQRQRQALLLTAGKLRVERFAFLPKLQPLQQIAGSTVRV